MLIVVDDAELVDDIGEALAALAASHRHGLMIVAAGKPDSLRQSYGHWTAVVRRSRLGLVATAANDLDGDLLGAMLPRRTPIAPRPGLMWLVADGDGRPDPSRRRSRPRCRHHPGQLTEQRSVNELTFTPVTGRSGGPLSNPRRL